MFHIHFGMRYHTRKPNKVRVLVSRNEWVHVVYTPQGHFTGWIFSSWVTNTTSTKSPKRLMFSCVKTLGVSLSDIEFISQNGGKPHWDALIQGEVRANAFPFDPTPEDFSVAYAKEPRARS